MERTLYTERLYSLGDFKNIKFAVSLTGMPEELALNDRIVNLIFFQQALSCEIAYRRYYDMVDHIAREFVTDKMKKTVDAEQTMQYLEEQREQTFAELYEEIQKVKQAKEEEK